MSILGLKWLAVKKTSRGFNKKNEETSEDIATEKYASNITILKSDFGPKISRDKGHQKGFYYKNKETTDDTLIEYRPAAGHFQMEILDPKLLETKSTFVFLKKAILGQSHMRQEARVEILIQEQTDCSG